MVHDHELAGLLGIVPALVVLSLAGCSSASSNDSARHVAEVAQLRTFERPALRAIKQTFIAVAAHRDAVAAKRLEQAATSAGLVSDWLRNHRSFVRANRDAVACLDDSLREIRERAEQLGPLLKTHAATAAQHRQLRKALGEAANCIEASD